MVNRFCNFTNSSNYHSTGAPQPNWRISMVIFRVCWWFECVIILSYVPVSDQHLILHISPPYPPPTGLLTGMSVLALSSIWNTIFHLLPTISHHPDRSIIVWRSPTMNGQVNYGRMGDGKASTIYAAHILIIYHPLVLHTTHMIAFFEGTRTFIRVLICMYLLELRKLDCWIYFTNRLHR